MMRVVGLELPDGSRVLVAYSAAGAVPGDPGVRPRTVRGHISTSGFVITPVEAGKCEVTMVVQVDPKVGLPWWLVSEQSTIADQGVPPVTWTVPQLANTG